ncbi:MAG: hypothetical protein MH219_16520 [Marinobacter sp.]|nr:hypothetical protein [Marinobacter sp.]
MMPRNGLGVESMRNRKTKLRSVMVLLTNAILITAVLTGLILLLTNFYGLTQSIRKPGLGVIDHEELRFIPREVWSYEQSLKAIEKLSDQTSAKHLVSEANRVVNSSLIHIDWLKVNPLEYRQLVPFWGKTTSYGLSVSFQVYLNLNATITQITDAILDEVLGFVVMPPRYCPVCSTIMGLRIELFLSKAM